jgi:16S rRNA (guanine527-N7)-methyltransferase
VKHIQDSLEVNKVLSLPSEAQFADIGTGGGFPLLPLAISNPQVQFTGIDSVKKKTLAVNEIIDQLGISNAKVVWERIEMYKSQTFDYVSARAVAHVDKLIPRAYHLLCPHGTFVLMKQKKEEEKSDLLQLCKKWNLQLLREHHYSLFTGDIDRVIYLIEKM